jgi:hypothetical protein
VAGVLSNSGNASFLFLLIHIYIKSMVQSFGVSIFLHLIESPVKREENTAVHLYCTFVVDIVIH